MFFFSKFKPTNSIITGPGPGPMEGLNFEPVLRSGDFCTGPQNIGYLFGLGCSDTNWETKHISFFRVSFFFSSL